VKKHAAELCPSPWRIPSFEDFVIAGEKFYTLDSSKGGFADTDGQIDGLPDDAYYWSISSKGKNLSWAFIWPSEGVWPIYLYAGLGVRCVR
jgi:hypothetical protein